MKRMSLGNVASTRGGHAGFTLIELLAVMTIIVILSGIGIGVARFASHRADLARARADMERIADALERYRVARGVYPDPGNTGWNKLATDRRGSLDERQGIADRGQEWLAPFNTPDILPFMEGLPMSDPWGGGEGQSYDYRRLSRFSFEMRSIGPDSTPGTADDVTRQP